MNAFYDYAKATEVSNSGTVILPAIVLVAIKILVFFVQEHSVLSTVQIPEVMFTYVVNDLSLVSVHSTGISALLSLQRW
jgi:hypothetical protein